MPPKRTRIPGLISAAVIGLVAAPLSAQSDLEIVSPSSRAFFRPGDTVTVAVRTNRKYQRVTVLPGYSPIGFLPEFLSAEPYRYSFRLPLDLVAGLYSFVAMGAPGSPGSPGFDESEPVEIDVEPVWPASDGVSEFVRDAPGVSVDSGGIPLRRRSTVTYPPEALAKGIEGTVVVEVTPESDGRVLRVKVISGPEQLAHHVVRSVSDWRYSARVGNTKPRRVTVTFSRAEGGRITPATVDASQRKPPGSDRFGYFPDNYTSTESWNSPNSLLLRFTIRILTIVGIPPEESEQLMAFYESENIREGGELTAEQLGRLKEMTSGFDPDLRMYLWLQQGDIAAVVAPFYNDQKDVAPRPPVQTERVPPSASPERVTVSAKDQARKLRSNPTAEYPWIAKSAHVQGVVRVFIIIGADGRVTNAHVLSGQPLLANAALEAVGQWAYSPTVVNGRAVEVVSEAEVEFHLPIGP